MRNYMRKSNFIFYVLLFGVMSCNLDSKVDLSQLQASLKTLMPQDASFVEDGKNLSDFKVLLQEYKDKVKDSKDKFEKSGHKFDFCNKVVEGLEIENEFNEDYVYEAVSYNVDVLKHIDAIVKKFDAKVVPKEDVVQNNDKDADKDDKGDDKKYLLSVYLLLYNLNSDARFLSDFVKQNFSDENLDKLAKIEDVEKFTSSLREFLDSKEKLMSVNNKVILEIDLNGNNDEILDQLNKINEKNFVDKNEVERSLNNGTYINDVVKNL
ncbi:hypothetical protein BRE_1043 (plasmid) [Borrelia recurrentis A1]|uniref:Lipoprotein n=2 Tax=Borrelia recurrentis TaxID=44449 RepID=B5RRW4_BORRA|nr:hypothetical protein BRE_1043 [Borrelia recurrentis A1]